MTPAAPATDIWADLYAATSSRLPGDGRVRALREAAIADLAENGFPTRRHEAWQYTSLAALTETTFEPAPAPGPLERAAALLADLPESGASCGRLVFVNGRLAPTLSSLDELPEGLEALSLADALAPGAEGAVEPLGSLLDGRGHPLAALNTALFEDGLLLRVRRGTQVPAPLHVVFLGVGGSAPSGVHPRLVYLVEDGARVAVAEWWRSESESTWLSNAAAEAWIGTNAGLDLLEVQEQALETLHFRSLQVRQAQDSHFASVVLALGARLARSDVQVRLEGTGAECRLDGLTLVQGEQHVDHQTYIDHAKPHGTSHQLYKGILDDRAQVVFSGRILVEPHAQKTDARQANHNLLLSPDAVADAKPQLEIFADDVKCAHGATVGQLDDDALFYLRSRGIGPREARRLLLHAFASELVERIPNADLARDARAVLDRHLPGGDL